MKPKVTVVPWLLLVLLVAAGCVALAPGLGVERGTPRGGGLSGGETEQPSGARTRTPSPTPTSRATAEVTPAGTAAGAATPDPAPSETATVTAPATSIPTARPTEPPAERTVPRVASLSAVAHEVVELSWETTGERVTICPFIDSGLVPCRCLYDLLPSGAMVIEPEQIIGNYSGFELTTYSNAGKAKARVAVDVRCPGHRDWFLEDPPALCPEGQPLYSWAAAQRFENGLMIWMEATDVYYIFYDGDLRVMDGGQGWSVLKSLQIVRGPLPLKPGASPENRVEETPPPGLSEPVSGFGLVWRGEVMDTEEVRDRLGWAVETEYGFEAVHQCQAACGAHWHCYLQGPEEAVRHLTYLMHVGHYWEWWQD